MSKVLDTSYQSLGSNARNRRLGRGIDIHYVHTVGLVKCAPKFVHQRLRSGVAMRLEQHVNSCVAAGAGSRESCTDLRRMVPIIVNHGDSARRAADLETPVDAAELLQALPNGLN